MSLFDKSIETFGFNFDFPIIHSLPARAGHSLPFFALRLLTVGHEISVLTAFVRSFVSVAKYSIALSTLIGGTMPRDSVSAEDFPISRCYSPISLSRPLLPPRSSSHNFALQDKRPKSVDLTYPIQAAFPSPPASEDGTPFVKASKARDAFPFPLQPAPVSFNPSPSRGRQYETPPPRPRDVSRELRYLTPPLSPDRYIPNRRSPDSSAKSFRFSKPSDQLTPIERLIRHQSASLDPFTTWNVNRVGQDLPPSYELHAGNPAPTPRRVATVAGSEIHGVRPGSIGIAHRRPSAGAVWNVGGSAAQPSGPITGISNGRGGLLGSGTNAPMFTSRFFEVESADQSQERLEGRLAAALDIDQTSRTLSISRSPEVEVTRSPSRPGTRGPPSGTMWRDGRWQNDDTQSGETPTTDALIMRKIFFIRRSYGSNHLTSQVQHFAGTRRSRQDLYRPRHSDTCHLSWNCFYRLTKSTVLDAPQLRDDFYCSVLAYCRTTNTLAVGLHSRVYLWSEESGVQYPRIDENRRSSYVTSLSFSSTEGRLAILAVGRNSGQVGLWSLFEEEERFSAQHPSSVACISFKPVTTRRPSERLGVSVCMEELLVGDEMGNIYYYYIEWGGHSGDPSWEGAMHLMAKISVHTQQICGLAWSPDGEYFASGGNDNACCLFEVRDILTPATVSLLPSAPLQSMMTGLIPNFVPSAPTHQTLSSILGTSPATIRSPFTRPLRPSHIPGRSNLVLNITAGRERHKWPHSAAVKAIAFCPWQRGLLATGGGSNDRAIHFYHAFSGACLATITVQAQVTSLIWSTTRREIAATFGYAQPEHPYRIAVFSWPDCKQVVAIPWVGEMRALYAVAYPGGPNEGRKRGGEGGRWWSRTAEEGCIVVASSDESVKFHEVWSDARKSTGGISGLLGGSDILEGLEGIEKEGREVIR